MKSQALRHARTLLSSLLLLFIISPAVRAGKTGNCTVAEKAASLLTPPTPDQQLLVNLMVILPNNTEALADGLRLRFNTGYLRSIQDDALKMNNFSENISSYRENTELIVERRPPIVSQDTVFLRLTHTTIRDYRFKMYAKTFGKNMIAYVEDAWLDKYQVIDLDGDTTNFTFNVTSDPASQASDRFRIIFVTFGTLPIHFTGISALAANNNIRVQWTAADDKEVTQYQIERSSNRVDFSAVGTVYPGSALYSWTDQHPVSGVNYYRIRSISKGGGILYSTTVKASLKYESSSLSVNPNPVANHTLQISLTGLAPATYSLLLLNSQGQAVMQQSFKHSGGSMPYSIPVNPAIPPGRYSLLIQQPGESPLQKSLVIL